MEEPKDIFDKADMLSNNTLSSIQKESIHNMTGLELDSVNYDSQLDIPKSRGFASMPNDQNEGKSKIGI